MALLDQALHGGRVGRVYRDLVLEKQVAVEADGGIDDIFGYNGPTQMVTRILHQRRVFRATRRSRRLTRCCATFRKTEFPKTS